VVSISPVSVRAATIDDLPTICALIRALGDYERMSDAVVFDEADMAVHLFGPDPAARVTLAVLDRPDDAVSTTPDEIMGFALWFVSFSTFLGKPGIWLEDLFVMPEHRNAGYGTALLRDLRDRTAGRVEWCVLDWNTPSIEFYDRLGATPQREWITYRWDPDGA
jgi:GNAT superfamily N-acetyltransferase